MSGLTVSEAAQLVRLCKVGENHIHEQEMYQRGYHEKSTLPEQLFNHFVAYFQLWQTNVFGEDRLTPFAEACGFATVREVEVIKKEMDKEVDNSVGLMDDWD